MASSKILLKIPPRDEEALTGSEFAKYLATIPPEERDKAIYSEIISGNIPSFLRKFVKIETVGVDLNGERHRVAYWVLPDYLSIGSDRDFIRIPMTPQTAQRIADQLNCLLPTKKIVDDIWRHATVKLHPQPIDVGKYDITSPLIFLLHQMLIENQRRGKPLGELTAGHKKDVVITNRLIEKPGRVAIYGWHYPDGKPIQPLSTVHHVSYYDYSHGIRLVKNTVLVDNTKITLESLLKDKVLCSLLSDEGAIHVTRYPYNISQKVFKKKKRD